MRNRMKRLGVVLAMVTTAVTMSLTAAGPAQADNFNGNCRDIEADACMMK